MMTAGEAPGDTIGTEADELDSLTPRSSALRLTVTALLAVLALVGAWFSPPVLRPSLDSLGSGSASSLELEHLSQLLTTSTITPRAWPTATLTAVEPVSGADVAAVWLLPTPTEDADVLPTKPYDPLAVLRAYYPDADVPTGGNLPQRFASGDQLDLVILWDVHSCDDLEMEAQPQATVRSALGTTRSDDPLWEANAPGYLLADEFGGDSALCR